MKPALPMFWKKKKPSLLVVGGGGHGRVVLEAALLNDHFARVVAVDPEEYKSWSLQIARCVEDEKEVVRDNETWVFVPAVGNAILRQKLFNAYLGKGFAPASVIHPASTISPSARLGRGVVVLAGIVGVQATIGDGVIVNNGAIVEHDCVVGDFSHLAPGAVLAGGSSLGGGCFLGANSSVRHATAIVGNVTVGHGAVVTRDIGAPGVYVGSPAKLMSDSKKVLE
jgi:sugar O-acyltransferase (sialic acid O-acetyltransferase NeuD family)